MSTHFIFSITKTFHSLNRSGVQVVVPHGAAEPGGQVQPQPHAAPSLGWLPGAGTDPGTTSFPSPAPLVPILWPKNVLVPETQELPDELFF